jgi:sugar-specific transcriptional regulator TrmB
MSSKQAIIYLTCIEKWWWSLAALARYTWINRTTLYNILKEMIELWFISTTNINKITHYNPIEYQQILNHYNTKISRLADIAPEIAALAWATWSKVKVEFYEWIDSVKLMFEHILYANQSSIRAFRGHHNEPLKEYFLRHFTPMRVQRNISAKVIATDELPTYGKTQEQLLREIRFVPEEFDSFKWFIYLYNEDTILFAISDDNRNTWVKIVSKNLYSTFSTIFDVMRKYSLAFRTRPNTY